MAIYPYLLRMGNHSERRVRRILLLCAITACFFLPFWFTNHLYANEDQPDVPGIITGVVKAPDGQPVAGVQVTLWRNYATTSWYIVLTGTTETDGSYRFTALNAGLYRIGVTDPQKRYGVLFYPAANVLQAAHDIPVAGNVITGIDLTLQAAGRIVVSVTSASPYTVTAPTLELYQRVETPIGPTWEQHQVVSINPNSDVVTFTGLAANSYRVCVGPRYEETPYECYDNVYALEKATDLQLTSGATINNVAIVLGDGADYAQLGGHVTDVNGNPLAGIAVYVWYVIPLGPGPSVAGSAWPSIDKWNQTLTTSGEPYRSRSTRTNTMGEYHFPTIRANEYRLQFIDPAGTYAFEFYQNKLALDEATVVTVTESQVITDVNVQLDLAAQIAGMVTLQNQPVQNGTVGVHRKRADGSWEFSVVTTNTNPNSGQYSIRGLPAGTYRVAANLDGETFGFYGGFTLADAIEIPLSTGGSAENINIALGGPQFAGSLSGRVTANNVPVAGAKVALYNVCCDRPTPVVVVYTFTDADGRYIFNGLNDAVLILSVTDPTGLYATTYYTSGVTPRSATVLYTQDQKALTDINVTLTPAGALSGRVQRLNGEAVTGLFVLLTHHNGQTSTLVNPWLDTRTDANGQYAFTGLQAGEYTVCFKTLPVESYVECYGGADGSTGGLTGKRVTVTAGKTSTDIDLIWGPDLRLYLPLVIQK